MNVPAIASVLASALAAFSVAVAAQEQSVCIDKRLIEARSLADLPPKLSSLLGQGRPGLEGIAERDGKFNLTDVVDSELPMRRFVLAGVGPTCAIVAVERGGRAHNYEVVEFEQIKTAWLVVQRKTIFTAPRSLEELIAHARK